MRRGGALRRRTRLLTAVVPLAAAAGAALALAAFDAEAPTWLPEIPVPQGNPLTEAKSELGRHLFFDQRLSGPGTVSCASCHRPELAFTDGRARAVGATGEVGRRGALSLANVAWMSPLTWADPSVTSLEEQLRIPLFGTEPVEMAAGGREEEILRRLQADARYAALFEAAFPGEPDPIAWENVERALASFERTLISVTSPYDRLLFEDDQAALTTGARRGMELFFSDRTGCATCHSGLAFSAASDLRRGIAEPGVSRYHDTGLHDPDAVQSDAGVAIVTGQESDAGRFRTPSLRNVALTAPYMHDGRFDTLEKVIAHYESSAAARRFSLTATETRDLIEFLESLTDTALVRDPRFADPWNEKRRSP